MKVIPAKAGIHVKFNKLKFPFGINKLPNCDDDKLISLSYNSS